MLIDKEKTINKKVDSQSNASQIEVTLQELHLLSSTVCAMDLYKGRKLEWIPYFPFIRHKSWIC